LRRATLWENCNYSTERKAMSDKLLTRVAWVCLVVAMVGQVLLVVKVYGSACP